MADILRTLVRRRTGRVTRTHTAISIVSTPGPHRQPRRVLDLVSSTRSRGWIAFRLDRNDSPLSFSGGFLFRSLYFLPIADASLTG
jgi:hypothetical protein